MSISDKLIIEEINQAVSLLEGVLGRLYAIKHGRTLPAMTEETFTPTDTSFPRAIVQDKP